MSFHSRLSALALVCLAFGSTSARAERIPLPPKPKADSVVYCDTHTSARDPNAKRVEALAIKDGKVLANGSILRVQGYIGANTTVEDQRGTGFICMPGFINDHDHIRTPFLPEQVCPVYVEPGQSPYDPSYQDAVDAAAVCAASPQFAGGKPMVMLVGPRFIVGSRGHVPRADLTAAAPLNPVVAFQALEGHGMTVNQAAFDAVGMASGVGAPDPYMGYLGRLPDDSADGHVQEMAQIPYFKLTADYIPTSLKAEQYKVWLNTALSQGSVYVMDIPYDGYVSATIPLADGIQHPVELDPACILLSADEECPAAVRANRKRWVKAFADGAIAACGGYTDYPYLDTTLCPSVSDPQWRGRPDLSRQELEARMRSVLAHPGQCLMVHAWGRAAARLVADVATEVTRATKQELCLTIEHLAMSEPATRAKLKAIGARIVVNPAHLTFVESHYMEPYHDPRELSEIELFRTLLDEGFIVGAGGDKFAVPEAPLVQIRRMVAEARPEERLTVEQAVEVFTRGSAEARRLSNLGTLEVGKDASYVVLDRNIFSGALADLEQAQVVKTVIKGQVAQPVPVSAQ